MYMCLSDKFLSVEYTFVCARVRMCVFARAYVCMNMYVCVCANMCVCVCIILQTVLIYALFYIFPLNSKSENLKFEYLPPSLHYSYARLTAFRRKRL